MRHGAAMDGTANSRARSCGAPSPLHACAFLCPVGRRSSPACLHCTFAPQAVAAPYWVLRSLAIPLQLLCMAGAGILQVGGLPLLLGWRAADVNARRQAWLAGWAGSFAPASATPPAAS